MEGFAFPVSGNCIARAQKGFQTCLGGGVNTLSFSSSFFFFFLLFSPPIKASAALRDTRSPTLHEGRVLNSSAER